MTLRTLRRLAAASAILGTAAGAAPAASPAPDPEPAAQARGAVTNLPLPRFVSMRAGSANARRGPSLDQRVDWEFVRRGLPLEITAEYGQWRRVRDADGVGGWVHHALLSGVRTALVEGDAAVPLRAGPSADAAVRAMAEPGVVGRIEACEGDWCAIAAGGFEGWLPRAAIWGVGPDETIE
jgi:SH3-like domain-containing protein